MMQSDQTSERILTLCAGLILLTILAGILMLGVIKSTLSTFEAEQSALRRQVQTLNDATADTRFHLTNARSIIDSTINRHQQETDTLSDSGSLSSLNSSIRKLAELLPEPEAEIFSTELDMLASGFIDLHYSARNWRIEYNSLNDLRTRTRPNEAAREYLAQLQSNLDRLLGINNHRDISDEEREPRRYTASAIRSELTEIGRLGEILSTSVTLTDTDQLVSHQLAPAFTHLLSLVGDKRHPELELLIDTSQVSHLASLYFGSNFNVRSGFENITPGKDGIYRLSRDRILTAQTKSNLNKSLDSLVTLLEYGMERISSAIAESHTRLEINSAQRKDTIWRKLLFAGLAEAMIFLLLVIYIYRSVREQVHLLTHFKDESDRANTASREYMERLVASEVRHRTVLDTISSAVITTDDQGFIEAFNPAAETMFDYKPEEIIGRHITALIPADKDKSYWPNTYKLRKLTQSEVPDKSIEIQGIHRDGSSFPISLGISEAVISGRTLYTGIITDISEQLKAEVALIQQKERAEASDRAKSEFLATMSHEIRTPMNSILGMSELLIDSRLDARQQRFVTNIHESGNSLLGIINDILDLSRIESHRLELQNAPFNLVSLMNETAMLFEEMAARKDIALEFKMPGDIAQVWNGDKKCLRQILNNLIGNAIKFTRQGTVNVEITACPAPNALQFIVSDTGIGITADAQKKIFESFSQVDSTSTRQYGGSGLGLTICRRLVEMMNGSIDVSSSPGHGARFRFDIEIEPSSGTELLENTPSSSPPPALSAHVLLVEDNQVNQEVALHMLEMLACTTMLATDGIEALTLLEKQHFDIVLMDCQMPRMDGYEATRLIRQHEQDDGSGRHIPVIALTANAMKFDRARCMKAGMDDYLSKPLTLDMLADAIERQLTGSPGQAPVLSPSSDTQFSNEDCLLPAIQVIDDNSQKQSINSSLLDMYVDMPDGITLLNRIIDVYLQEAPAAIHALRYAINENDPATLARAAHKFKSSNVQLGAESLADLCTQLDRLGKIGTTSGGWALLSDVEEEFEYVKHTLSEIKRRSGDSNSIVAKTAS